MWHAPHEHSPILKLKAQNPDIIVCISASPFEHDKYNNRIAVSRRIATHLNTPLLFVNMVGANDEIVFDGSSFIIDNDGSILHTLAHCKEDSYSFEYNNNTLLLHEPSPTIPSSPSQHNTHPFDSHNMEHISKVLELGLKDYLQKNRGLLPKYT